MPEVLRMPELAANTPEAVVSAWTVELGAPYRAGDALVTLETEKAAVDLEAETDGVLLRLLAEPGTSVEVGTPIAVWGNTEESDGVIAEFVAGLGLEQPPAQSDPDPGPGSEGEPEPLAASGRGTDPWPRLFSSPLARRIAKDRGVDLATVKGTGPRGRIRRRDVEAACAAAAAAPAPAPASAAPAAAADGEAPDTAPVPRPAPAPATTAPSDPAVDQNPHQDVPADRLRQAIARRLTESKQTTPHFYLRGTARVDRLVALRAELNAGGSDEPRISVNDLIVKAVAHAHRLVPELNAVWTGAGTRRYSGVDVAVAVATEGGLVTPVLRGAESLSVGRIAAATRDLAERGRARRLQPRELEGGTITVSNLGMYGTEEFAAIINPPHSAILAVGATRRVPVVEGESVGIGTVVTVTLSVDHRAVDGEAAARWMRAFVELLESPLRIVR